MNHNKPPRTEIVYRNEAEQLKFKERRNFTTWREKTEFYFDKLWRDAKFFGRIEGYVWLSNELKLTSKQAHINHLTNEQCDTATKLCQQILNDLRRIDLDLGVEPETPYYEII